MRLTHWNDLQTGKKETVVFAEALTFLPRVAVPIDTVDASAMPTRVVVAFVDCLRPFVVGLLSLREKTLRRTIRLPTYSLGGMLLLSAA